MEIDFDLWMYVQAIIASAFLVPTMWRLFRTFADQLGWQSTPALITLFMGVHGAFGAEFFAERAWITSLSSEPSLTVTYIGPLGLILAKCGLVWVGEDRGRTRVFVAFVAATLLWTLSGVLW